MASPAAAQTADAAAAREKSAAVPVAGALLLFGKPFPAAERFASTPPSPRRTFFAAAGTENGDGGEAHPWNDLQAALCALSPGDRLRVRAGAYAGTFRIDGDCRDGAKGAPIQVVFDGKASLTPKGEGAALTIRRSRWLILGAFVELGASAAAGISIEAGSRGVTLDGARVAGGTGPGIRIAAGASDVTVVNARVSKSRVASPGPASIGIQVAAGTDHVALINNRLHENPAGSIRVEAPAPGEAPASDLRVSGNAIQDDDSTAIFVAAADRVRVTGNTIADIPGRTETRGIGLEQVRDVVVRENHVSRCALGIQVGRADPSGGAVRRARDVTIDHNVFDNAPRSGAALVVEAGERIRFANNVVQGYASGFLIFGKPPRTSAVTAANNLVLEVSDTAVKLEDAAAVPLLDYNVFSPAGAASVEIGARTLTLVRWLKEGALPHARMVPGVRILNGDLARIEGVDTVDRGRKMQGIVYKGAAPDIGVAER